MNGEGIIIDWEFLEGSSIGMLPKLEAMPVKVFLEVVSMLVLRQEEVVAVATTPEIQELLWHIVQNLIFLLEFLEFFVEFEEFKRVDFIFLSFLLRSLDCTGSPLGSSRRNDLGIITGLPLADGDPQELLTSHKVDFVVWEQVQLDISALTQLIPGVIYLFVEEVVALFYLLPEEA